MCHHEGYHTALSGQVDGVEWAPREPRDEFAYDLPWRVLAAFVGTVAAIGMGLSLVIELLS